LLRLFLLRHAKSSWAMPGQRDFDRPLNERGRGDLPKIAALMSRRGFIPGHVYCSPAARTRETLAGILPAFSSAPGISYESSLYQGDARTYYDCLRDHGEAEALMIVGHNPACEELAVWLAGGGAGAASIEEKFPTGALAVIEFDAATWPAIQPSGARLADFVAPAAI